MNTFFSKNKQKNFTCAVDGESKRKLSKYVKGVTEIANKIIVMKHGKYASSIKDSF